MAGTLVVDTINSGTDTNLTIDPNGTGVIVAGADIDIATHQLSTKSDNRDIELAPHGTGAVEVRGNTNSGTIKLNCENNSHAVSVQGPAHSAGADYTLVLPTSTGTANQVLDIASVSGTTLQLGWADDATGAGTGANTFSAAQTVTISTQTSDGALDMDASNFIHVGANDYNTDPTGLNIGTSGLFVATSAAPTDWHSDFKHPGGSYTAPTAFPAVAPWYINAANSILVGTWTQCGT